MDSKDEEKRIAMTLARRAYLYGAFHVVFGGGVHEASAAQLFGENTAGALAWLAVRWPLMRGFRRRAWAFPSAR